MPLDRQFSALAQVPQMTREHSQEAWSDALDPQPAWSSEQRDLTTLLLAVNYELLGYSPAEAWMFADREMDASPDWLDE